MINDKYTEEYRHVISHSDVYFKYLTLIKPSHYQSSLTLHNAGHAYRVLVHSIILSSIQKLTCQEMDILCTAAVFHDIGRINDGIDVTHGFRSWLKYKHNICLDKTNTEKIAAIKTLIINHCLDDKHIQNFGDTLTRNRHLLSILKDADALDRIRNNKLDVRYLHYKESINLITFASELYGKEYEFHSIIVKSGAYMNHSNIPLIF